MTRDVSYRGAVRSELGELHGNHTVRVWQGDRRSLVEHRAVTARYGAGCCAAATWKMAETDAGTWRVKTALRQRQQALPT